MLSLVLKGASHAHIPCPLSSGLDEQMVDFVRADRSLRSPVQRVRACLSKPSATGREQDDLDKGRCEDGLTTEERAELRRLRREHKKLKMEREILVEAAAWFAQETETLPESSRS